MKKFLIISGCVLFLITAASLHFTFRDIEVQDIEGYKKLLGEKRSNLRDRLLLLNHIHGKLAGSGTALENKVSDIKIENTQLFLIVNDCNRKLQEKKYDCLDYIENLTVRVNKNYNHFLKEIFKQKIESEKEKPEKKNPENNLPDRKLQAAKVNIVNMRRNTEE